MCVCALFWPARERNYDRNRLKFFSYHREKKREKNANKYGQRLALLYYYYYEQNTKKIYVHIARMKSSEREIFIWISTGRVHLGGPGLR